MARGKNEEFNPKRRPTIKVRRIIKMNPEAIETVKDAHALKHPFENSETEERAMRQLKEDK